MLQSVLQSVLFIVNPVVRIANKKLTLVIHSSLNLTYVLAQRLACIDILRSLCMHY